MKQQQEGKTEPQQQKKKKKMPEKAHGGAGLRQGQLGLGSVWLEGALEDGGSGLGPQQACRGPSRSGKCWLHSPLIP